MLPKLWNMHANISKTCLVLKRDVKMDTGWNSVLSFLANIYPFSLSIDGLNNHFQLIFGMERKNISR